MRKPFALWLRGGLPSSPENLCAREITLERAGGSDCSHVRCLVVLGEDVRLPGPGNDVFRDFYGFDPVPRRDIVHEVQHDLFQDGA